MGAGAEAGNRPDFEDKDMKMAGDLVADADAVTDQVEEGEDLQTHRQRLF